MSSIGIPQLAFYSRGRGRTSYTSCSSYETQLRVGGIGGGAAGRALRGADHHHHDGRVLPDRAQRGRQRDRPARRQRVLRLVRARAQALGRAFERRAGAVPGGHGARHRRRHRGRVLGHRGRHVGPGAGRVLVRLLQLAPPPAARLRVVPARPGRALRVPHAALLRRAHGLRAGRERPVQQHVRVQRHLRRHRRRAQLDGRGGHAHVRRRGRHGLRRERRALREVVRRRRDLRLHRARRPGQQARAQRGQLRHVPERRGLVGRLRVLPRGHPVRRAQRGAGRRGRRLLHGRGRARRAVLLVVLGRRHVPARVPPVPHRRAAHVRAGRRVP